MKVWILASDGYYDLHWTTSTEPDINVLVKPDPISVTKQISDPPARPDMTP
jgi:hypothetical protein